MDGEHLSADGSAPPGHLAGRRYCAGVRSDENKKDEAASVVYRTIENGRALAAVSFSGGEDVVAVLSGGKTIEGRRETEYPDK